jgi:hypothetical protein
MKTPQELFGQGLLPDEGAKIVDFSTGAFKLLTENNHGLTWETEDPPPYVFGRPPEGAVYRPRWDAIKFVWRLILEKMAKKPELLELIPA